MCVSLVTRAKEVVIDPAIFLDNELDALLNRLAEVDRTKWQALAELGLGALPAGTVAGGVRR